MGIFDFFKRDKPKAAPPAPVEQESDNTVKYETKFRGTDITTDVALIEKVIAKMVEEDPFQRFYQGMSDTDFGPGSRRVFEYTDITTLNVDVSDDLKLTIEGITLGEIPANRATEVKRNREQYMLTAYVYVTGGKYKEYSQEEDAVVEGSIPYNLDIFIQFT